MTNEVIIHRDFTVGEIDPRLYGAHLGAAGGADHAALADADHPAAEDGYRADILDLVRAYRLPCILGVSPLGGRNAILADGLVDWCRRADAEPMLSMDLAGVAAGRFGPAENRDVRMWHFGLEPGAGEADGLIDGLRAGIPAATLVLGAADADLDRAIRIATRHRRSIDLLSVPGLAQPPAPGHRLPWSTALARTVDALAQRLDRDSAVDRCGRPVGLQVDHWGGVAPGADPVDAALDRALALNVLVRRADRIHTAFAGGVIAGLADMLDDRIGMGHRRDLFDPLLAGSVYGRGISLMPAVRGHLMEMDDGGSATVIDAAAVRDDDSGALTVFLANRSTGPATASLALHGFAGYLIAEHRLADPAPRLPGRPVPAPAQEGARVTWTLPGRAYGLVRLCARRH